MASSRRPRFTVKGYGGQTIKSFRDVGKLGYGSGGAADSPWTRKGIFIQGGGQAGTGGQGCKTTGGPGLPLERRDRVENPGHKRVHEFIAAPNVCLTCGMLEEGHDRLMEKLR